MIPILYTPLETDFTSNGIGRLTDCISCTVTEERNGIFECEFEYPINGKFYTYLIENTCYIGVIHDDNHDIQPFEVYRHSDPIDGIVTFNAHHISYQLGNVIVDGIEAYTVVDAFDQFLTHNITGCHFSFWTDKASSGTFKVTHPDNVRALLCGQQGSILDAFGTGEYEFDKHTVKLYAQRGLDRGVTIRYGKNLTDIERTYDESGTYNAVVPFWADQDGNVITLPEGYIAEVSDTDVYPWEESINGPVMEDGNGNEIDFANFVLKATALDLSNEFQEQPSVADLRAAAQAYLTNNQPWQPSDNITVDFVQLWETPEYENVAALQRVSLCDTVSVYYPQMEIAVSAKVIRIVYNVLTERYDEMELGEPKATLAGTIESNLSAEIDQAVTEVKAFTDAAIEHATDLITGGLGGYVVMSLNAQGQPQEILIMDTPDVNTAVNVIRMNKNGIGFSTNGYEGPFTSAWTIDGHFNADFITTGTMLANRIYGGTLTVGGLNNEAGVFRIKDADGNVVVTGNKDGLTTTVLNATDYIYVNGTEGSYLKIPWETNGQQNYLEISSNGIEFKESNTYVRLTSLSGTGYMAFEDTEREKYTGITPSIINLSDNSTTDIDNLSFTLRPYQMQMSGDVPVYGSSIAQIGLYGSQLCNAVYVNGTLQVNGNFSVVNGTKNRIVDTGEYALRKLYCYETPSPLFGDVGEGVIDETGYCYVFLDPIFAETISTNQYQVFLQKYGNGDCWVSERKSGYFVVQGTAGMKFGWELKAKQKDFDQLRLEKDEEEFYPVGTDYGKEAEKYLKELEEGRQTA